MAIPFALPREEGSGALEYQLVRLQEILAEIRMLLRVNPTHERDEPGAPVRRPRHSHGHGRVPLLSLAFNGTGDLVVFPPPTNCFTTTTTTTTTITTTTTSTNVGASRHQPLHQQCRGYCCEVAVGDGGGAGEEEEEQEQEDEEAVDLGRHVEAEEDERTTNAKRVAASLQKIADKLLSLPSAAVADELDVDACGSTAEGGDVPDSGTSARASSSARSTHQRASSVRKRSSSSSSSTVTTVTTVTTTPSLANTSASDSDSVFGKLAPSALRTSLCCTAVMAVVGWRWFKGR